MVGMLSAQIHAVPAQDLPENMMKEYRPFAGSAGRFGAGPNNTPIPCPQHRSFMPQRK